MKKTLLFVLVVFVSGFIILPNIFNQRERTAYSDDDRLESARRIFEMHTDEDSVKMPLSTFYDRGKFVRFLFGTEYRKLWALPVAFPVWNSGHLEYTIGSLGGGDQTTSLDITGPEGRTYTLRSVNKDQARAVTPLLRPTLARTISRDQASSLNPYAAPVVASLSGIAGIPHMNPVLYYIPYNPEWNEEENKLLAGRVMLMEEEPDRTWNHTERFGRENSIITTKKMMTLRSGGKAHIDSVLFARCRIFDVLIGDWDRHEKQWMWAYDSLTGMCTPLPVDRDMAFYDFSGGVIDQLALFIVPKFQTFDKAMPNLEGYLKNGIHFQKELLRHVSKEQWLEQAAILKANLSANVMDQAFRTYPADVYDMYGDTHLSILAHRVARADSIALYLYESVQ